MKDGHFKTNRVIVARDFETAERYGVMGTFQVVKVILEVDGDEIDVTGKLDIGAHYHSAKQVVSDLGLESDIEIVFDDEDN